MESLNKRASPFGSGMTANLAPTARPWAHLSPDLLLDISSRLDDAADFARFHAVCMPWRAAAPSQHSPATATRPAFPSWHLALCDDHIVRSTVDIQCITSFEEEPGDGCGHDDITLADPQGATLHTDGGTNWVASADGAAAWLFVAGPKPRLINLLTGAVNPLPLFPEDDEIMVPTKNVRGIVYRDGTVFLYSFMGEKMIAAILRPGDTAWTVMRRFLEVPARAACRRSAAGAMYHDGEVLICVGYFWSLLTRGDLDGQAGLRPRWGNKEEKKYSREYDYLLESRGELLWASVLLAKRDLSGNDDRGLTSSLSVTVHALEKGADDEMRWVRRDGWSLADRVLFLGCPASFAADAHRLGIVGGCAYFVFMSCVYRYSLVDGEAELVKQLRPRWGIDGAGVWLPRQPTIAPIQEIRDGLSLYPSNYDLI
ncbi:unnamed protein product [Alopecurus aequalis]